MDWVEAAKVLGVPGALLFAGLAWLARDRSRILDALGTAQTDASNLRDKRAEDLAKYSTEIAQIGEASRVVVKEATAKLDQVLQLLTVRG